MGKLRGEYSEPVLIELYVGADDKNSSINILQVNPLRFFEILQEKKQMKFMEHSLFYFTAGSASFGVAKSRLLFKAKQ